MQVEWTVRNAIIYPAIGSLAGLVAGMFGVGGGIVKVRPPPPPSSARLDCESAGAEMQGSGLAVMHNILLRAGVSAFASWSG